jgi:hypothetical protein
MTWGFISPRPSFYARFVAIFCQCLLGGRMLAGGRLVKNGPIGLDQPSGSPPARPHSVITVGTDPAAGLSLVSALPIARLAPVQRTQSAPSLPELGHFSAHSSRPE